MTEGPGRSSAYYTASVPAFLADGPDAVLGRLSAADGGNIDGTQIHAWQTEIGILRTALEGMAGALYLEFVVPRLGSRIDAVLITGPAIFPIEFKCGESRFETAAVHQAWDYALDLKNFHAASHDAAIFPLLVATDSRKADNSWEPASSDRVHPPRRCTVDRLSDAIHEGLAQTAGVSIDSSTWGAAPYHPTPTIVEAARALFAGHSVEEISRNDAGATNLSVTSSSVEAVIEAARLNHEKAIVFVTGVPGAGKTLVGLNIATRRKLLGESRAVYLSGNGPLVAVLQEALVRSERARPGNVERVGAIRQRVKPFIQNVHHFRDEGIRSPAAPDDHVVIFDEAQRAWTRRKASDFMRRRKNVPDFRHSEPEFLISCMDRHQDWAVIVCLVGGGQEIHTGEAGIGEWLDSVRAHFPTWRVYISPSLADGEYAAVPMIDGLRKAGVSISEDENLHLATSMRSYRSSKVSAFVKAVLDCDTASARNLLAEVAGPYPIAVTRDLGRAKAWIRQHARGSERYGLVASSEAQRLKPHAIDIRYKADPVQWFLYGPEDTRSSYYLEDAATEFQVQGLELDWACITWDADLRKHEDSWSHHSFRGSKWTTIRADDRKKYLLNAYRVLLTRARQGMVIFIPAGDPTDATRPPGFYDATYSYLREIGVAVA